MPTLNILSNRKDTTIKIIYKNLPKISQTTSKHYRTFKISKKVSRDPQPVQIQAQQMPIKNPHSTKSPYISSNTSLLLLTTILQLSILLV